MMATSLYSWLSITLLTIVFTTLIYLWNKNSQRRNLINKLPHPPAIPILGNILPFLLTNDCLEAMTSICNRFDGICRINLFTDDVVVVTSPACLKTFYSSRNTDKADLYDPVKDIFYKSLFISNGATWKKTLKIYLSYFFSTPPDLLLATFRKRADEMVDQLSLKANGDFFPLLESLQKVAAHSLFELAFDDPATLDILQIITQDVEYLMKVCFLRTNSPIYFFRPLFRLTPEGGRFYTVVRRVRETAERFVHRKMQQFQEMKERGEEPPSKFVYSIMKNHPEKSVVDIASEMINLVPAAIDTTSETTGFIITMLALHPEVQERIFLEDKEIRSGLDGRDPGVSDMPLYTFFDAVVKETLRLFPVAPIIGRKLSEDTYFGEYLVPANTNVLACQYYSNLSAKYFEEPLTFKPERFLAENAKRIVPNVYNPFSNGPRGCPGQKYSFLSINTFVLAIVRKFRIFSKYKGLDEALHNSVAELTLKDKNSFTICLKRR